MSRDPFTLLAEGQDEWKRAARRTLAEHTGGILLCICLTLTALFPLVVLEVINPFSPEFFLRTAYNALTSTLCYLLFLPEGVRGERERDRAFTETADRLERLSATVRGGHLAAFSAYCMAAAKAECEEERERIRLRAAALGGRREKRLSARAERLAPHRIYPTLILVGEGAARLNDVGRRTVPYGTGGALLRPILVLATATLFSSVAVLPGAAPDAATAVRIITGLFGVSMAAFAGYTAGRTRARAELGRCERRILFLSGFCEKERIPLPL